jgi:hypothetical protein
MRRIIGNNHPRNPGAARDQRAGAAPRKLVLTRETLRELASTELQAADGGTDPCSSSRETHDVFI